MVDNKCVPVSIKYKRGTQQSVNDHKPADYEPIYAIDTNRLFVGYDNRFGGYDILEGNVSSILENRYYGSHRFGGRGFNPLPNEITVSPKEVRLVDNAALGLAFDIVDCVEFPNSDSSVYIMINKHPSWDVTKDVNIAITYSLDSASSNDTFELDSSVWGLELYATVGSADFTYTDIITADSTNISKIQNTNLTNIKLPSSILSSEKFIILLERDHASDTSTGIFQLINITFSQCLNGSLFGYYFGGSTRTSGTDNAGTTNSSIQRLTFPFDNGTMNVSGNLSSSRGMGGGFNSSTHGYVAGGYIEPALFGISPEPGGLTRTALSSVERIIFPFASGTTTTIGNLSSAFGAPASCNSSQNGYTIGGLPSQKYTGNSKQQIEETIFSFDSYTKSESVATIPAGRNRNGGFNSSSHGFSLGGGSVLGPKTSTVYRLAFSGYNVEEVQSLNLVDYTGAALDGGFDFATCNSSEAGYTLGGQSMIKVFKYLFPFASPSTSIQIGNLASSKSGASGLNSSVFGYSIAGGNYTYENFYSLVERINFAFSSGNATTVGNLAGSSWDRGITCDGTDFVSQFI